MGQLLVEVPAPLNVSAGTVVSSTCSSNITTLSDLFVRTIPTISGQNIVITNMNGVTRHTITFVAPLTLTSVTIGCFASEGPVTDDRYARIRIQG